MYFLRDYQNYRTQTRGCVATIGNFDGIHLGHQHMINEVKNAAKINSLPSVIITFEPLPKEFLQTDNMVDRLLTLKEKLSILERINVDTILCLRFNNELANMSSEDFIKEILVKKINAKHLIVGDDFHFGKNRTGNTQLLHDASKIYDFKLTQISTYEIDDDRVSSSRIRKLLKDGDIINAQKLLGRDYEMSGNVIYGDNLGAKLGFPTANIKRSRPAILKGVFVVAIKGLENDLYGVTNVGNRPTVGGIENRVETHIFDFNKNIYGAHIRIIFLKKIRDEVRFDSVEQLKEQIEKDILTAKEYLKKISE